MTDNSCKKCCFIRASLVVKARGKIIGVEKTCVCGKTFFVTCDDVKNPRFIKGLNINNF